MRFSRTTTHTARVPHVCEACLLPVAVGETYLRWVGRCEGSICTNAYHPDCRAVEIEVNEAKGIQDADWMFLHEHISEGRKDALDGAPDAVQARFAADGAAVAVAA